MSAANDNGGAVRDLGLPGFGLVALMPGPEGLASDLVAGGLHHAATVTLRTVVSSSGKLPAFTGGTERRVGNLRPAPAELNAVAGQLAAMLAELPVRGGIVDRLA